MRVSMRGDYGLRALLELAKRFGEGPVQSGEIAARQGIPEAYLDQLLTVLRKGGLVKSTRGPQGGHALLRPPQEITVGRALALLEGSLSPMGCLDDPTICGLSGACVLRDLWRQVDEAARGILESTTIADLVNRQRQMEAQVRYYI